MDAKNKQPESKEQIEPLKAGRYCLIIGEYSMKTKRNISYPILKVHSRGKEPRYWNVEKQKWVGPMGFGVR